MTSVRASACIVGGGPGGLVLGLLLAKRGADFLVLEGHEDFEREFRGEVLQPSTAHLLDELGLLEYVLAQPHSLLEVAKIRLNGKEVGEVVGGSGFRHGKEPFEVRSDVVVGADGRHSTVARLGRFEPEYEHHDFDVIWFTIEQPPGWSSTFYVSLGDIRGLML